MAFQVYDRRSRPVGSEPVCTIQSRGTLGLNAAAFELIQSHRPDDDETWAQLLYDPDEKIIAVRAVEPESSNSYPIRKQKHANSYLMTAKGFLNFHGVPLGAARHYSMRDHGEGIVGFSLTEDELS